MTLFRTITIFLSAFSAWGIAAGQSQEGRILGTVTDQSGGLVKGARVTITNVDTGVTRTLETNDAGDYVAPSLPPGPYKLVVEATGFKKIERGGIRLEVAKDIRLDLTMQPGSVSETVTVSEQIPLVETTNDTLGGTFANQSINDLPLNGRDFQNLVVLRPGVQRSPGGGFLSISSNGNRPEDNNFIVDGTDNNDPYYGTTVINAEGVQGTPGSILPIDAIQEFNAQENPPAEYGWKPGAIINLGLKSGTNDVHGTAYYFGRNDNLDARNYFNAVPDPKRELRQHQFGGSLGGPIIKNKTFIFGAYEGIRGLVANSEILESPATVGFGGSDPANSIPDAIASVTAHAGAGQVSALSSKLANLFPANSGTLDPKDHASLLIGFPNHNRNDNFLIKGDHHFNERHSISGRYFFGDSLQIERDIAVLRPEWQSSSQLRAQVVGANYNWIPNAHWVNEAKFGYNRFWQAILTVDHAADPAAVYGINTGVTTPINFGMPEIAIGPFTSLGGNHGWPLLTTPNETSQFADNLSYLHGKHTLRFGGEFRHGHTHNIRDRYGKSRIRFTGGRLSTLCNCYPTGVSSTALEDFIAGTPRRSNAGRIFIGNSERDVTINSFGVFIQDDWRVTPTLTVNIGLRYDLNGVIHEANDRLANFDPATGIHQVGKGIDSPYNGDHNNFAPRAGIAWDPRGNSKTVVRAGAGIMHEIPHLSVFLGQNGVNNASTAGLNVIPTDPSSGIPGSNGNILATSVNFPGSALNWTVAGPVFRPSVNCSASPCDILGVNRNLRTPYVITWNLNIQQALTKTTSLQVAYVGNHGVKQYSVRDINQVDPNSAAEIACGNCEQDGRPFATKYPFLGYINFLENGYTSIYHGLQTTLTQHASHGLNFVAGYTWAHAIDFVSLNRAAQPQDSFNPAAERASGDQDIRHRLTLAITYDLPSRKGTHQVLEGWQMNSIVYFQTGAPWGLVDGFANGNDISLTGEFSDRWNIVGNPKNITWFKSASVPFFDFMTPQTSPKACLDHADPAQLALFGCFIENGTILVPPNAGRFGNLGRNTFRGPSQSNWDFSLVKSTRITERISFQFRAEFFNILNHPHFANPATPGNIDPSVPGAFGRSGLTPDIAAANPVIGTGGPRNIQFGLKFRF
jgi:hypothetical protein